MTLTKNKTLLGIILMVLAMAAFALADTLVKLMSATVSPAQVLFLMIGGGLVAFTTMAKLQGESLIDRQAFAPALLIRYLSEVLGMVGMVMALANVPLSTVGAITQATPLMVTIGAVLFLGEKVSWRRWCAIGVGFFGVMLIVQPGSEGFDVAVLWAILAVVGLSIRDLTTRLTPPEMASSALASYTMMAAIPFAAGWVLFNGESLFSAQTNWFMALGMICLGSFGYMLLIASIRMTEVSTVAPFRYSRILFLLVLGIVVFNERPSLLMLIGASLVIVSGIYMMWREKKTKVLAV